jgi:hypothetical protein
MDAQAIKTLGGICQIVGVLIVVRDLLAIHAYLGDLERLMARLRVRGAPVQSALRQMRRRLWASVQAALHQMRRRRMRRRPGPSAVVLQVENVDQGMAVDSLTIRQKLGPFVHDPGQSSEEQLTAQAEYLNRLRDWIDREVEQQRDQAILAEREQARVELRREGERLDRAIADARHEVNRLRRLTTGGIGSRWAGVPLLLAGVAFSTWDEELAVVWPGWLSELVLGFLIACGVAAWLCWAILARLRADTAASP